MLADTGFIQSAVAVAVVCASLLTAWVGYLQFKSSKRQRQQELDAAEKARIQENRMRVAELGQESLEAALARADIERGRQDTRIEGLIADRRAQDDRIAGLVHTVGELTEKVDKGEAECRRRLDLLANQLQAAGISPDPEARVS